MEYLGFACFVFGGVCFVGGICVGCWIHQHLATVYKRNAAVAYQEGVEKAKQEHLAKLQSEGEKVASNPLFQMHKEEREKGFEESLANLYPNDPKIQQQIKEERELKKKLGSER